MRKIVSLFLACVMLITTGAGLWNADEMVIKTNLHLTVKEEIEKIPFYCIKSTSSSKKSENMVKACGKIDCTKKAITNLKNSNWNTEMINIKLKEKKNKPQKKQDKVKIAILDSGVDYGNDIQIAESMNFVEDFETSPLFVDDTGHGTSVAGIIAAEDDEDGITGINSNVELYSARVLKDNKAPIDRVVAGIDWAIKKKVNIINLSFSTKKNSRELHRVIQKAYKKGILIVAAAGNEKEVEYPAAYKEVIAVGSIKSNGEKSEKSAVGNEIEVVAPGEKVKSSALLNGTVVVSGTSIAAPQVSAIASLLWEKDINMPAEFIRDLLNKSANKCGPANECGSGLIDYEYALKIYDRAKKEYNERKEKKKFVTIESADVESTANENDIDAPLEKIEKNNSIIIGYEKNNMVEGRWAKHDSMVADYTDVTNFQKGAKEPDCNENLKGLNKNMAWHGGRFVNCIAVYRYLNKVARAVNDLDENASLTKIKETIEKVENVKGMDVYEYQNLNSEGQKKYKNGVYSTVKNDLLKYVAPLLVGKSKRKKEAFVFGLASHTATDMYAHSSFRRSGNHWYYIKHIFKDNGQVDVEDPLCADNQECVVRRFLSAKKVLSNIVDRFNNTRMDTAIVRDFAIDSPKTEGIERKYYNTYYIEYKKSNQRLDATYRLYNFKQNMNNAGESDKKYLDMYSLASVYPVYDKDDYNTIK